MMSGSTDGMLVEAFTGLVVESLAVKQDFGTATVGCRECASGERRLGNGDRARVALSCYEDFSWEIEGVYCPDHAVESVAETMGVRPEKQAVVDTVLESTGYHTPRGDTNPTRSRSGLSMSSISVRPQTAGDPRARDGYPDN